jgi:predicted GNAT family N-acyltransferase
VAMARVVTDSSTFAYLADVIVHEEHRGKGLSKWIMDEVMRHPDLQSLRRFVLATRDAHSLYVKYGFAPLTDDEILRFMGLQRRDEI